MKTILAPIDFSGATDAVIAEASTLARAVNGKVLLLSVIQPPIVINEYAPLSDNFTQIAAAGEKNASRKLAALQEEMQSAGIAADTVQLSGSAVYHILAEAKRVSADFIVMGSHGHTALYDLLVGSTTHGVLMRAECPVVIVPASRQPAPKPARAALHAVP